MFAMVTVLPADRWTVTANSEYRMLRPVQAGSEVRLVADVVKIGRTLGHVDAALTIDGVPHVQARYIKSVIRAS